jgi:GNAT superfamily N-acetyltransferase
MNTMITTREAAPTDAPAIALLLAQLGYATGAEDVARRVAGVAGDGGAVFVAVDESDRALGVASATRHATLHVDGGVAYITALVTDSNARGRGVGRALVSAIEQWARARGAARLSVTSAEHRADAHEFYPACGFPYTGRRFSKSLD